MEDNTVIDYSKIKFYLYIACRKYICKMNFVLKKIFEYVKTYNDIYNEFFLASDALVNNKNLVKVVETRYEMIPSDIMEKLIFHKPFILKSEVIPITSSVVEYMSKFDFIYLENRMDELDHDLQKKIILKDESLIKYISNPSEELWIAALNSNRYIFDSIKQKHITDKIAMCAINLCTLNFKHIINPSEKVCIEAVKLDPTYLGMIRCQTNDICIAALNKDMNSYKYIKYPSDKVKEFYEKQKNTGISKVCDTGDYARITLCNLF